MKTTAEDIKFSIIIPVYNAEKYISDCIKSILNQTYKNFEIIIIDDGSQDNSLDLCYNFAKIDKRINIHHKNNGGVSSARNHGLKFISGDYLLFVDADDMISPECLFNFYLCIIETNTDICFHEFTFIKDTDTNKLKNVNNNASLKNECKRIKLNDFYYYFNNKWILFSATWSKCYKVSIIKEFNITFSTAICLYEDYLFLLEYLAHTKKIYITLSVGYQYRIVKNSLSRGKNTQSEKYINYILQNKNKCIFSGYSLQAYKLWIKNLLTVNYYHLGESTRNKIIDTCKTLRFNSFHCKILFLLNILLRINTQNKIIDLYLLLCFLLKKKLAKYVKI